MALSTLPFPSLIERVLQDLTNGRCVSLIGLSNTGKSTFMRALAGPQAGERYHRLRGKPGLLIYVDCNRAVAISAQAFYEVVLRSLLENLEGRVPATLVEKVRQHHEAVTEAENAFTASLAFNLALTELCEGLEQDLLLLLDEFDEIYTSLEERALLNMRALRDRFRDRLAYVVATLRTLPQLRHQEVEDEFAELFSRFIYALPPLRDKEADELLKGLKLKGLTAARRAVCLRLAGGHPGLLVALAQALAGLPKDWQGDLEAMARGAPGARVECLKIWSQLHQEEQAALTSLALDVQAGLPPKTLQVLERLGLVRAGRLFSPVFESFVARRGRGARVAEEGVYLDPDSGDVWVDGVRIPVLTDLEFRLLNLLYERRDKLTDKYRIVTGVWGEEYLGDVDDARVEKLVSRLRSKIEPDPANPRYLITQRGRGYKLLSTPRGG